MQGYTVVDAATVVATHLSQLLQTHAHELLGHEETQQLMERLAQSAPKLVDELTPKLLPMSVIARVLQNLLEERIPVRNIRRIAETLAEQGAKTQDPEILSAAVRVALGRSIVQNVAGMRAELPVLTLDGELEKILNDATKDGSSLGLEPGLVERLHTSLRERAEKQEVAGEPAVLLVAPNLRPWLSRMMRGIRNLHVLAYTEIPDDRRIQMVGALS
jgi:flagellar biosynthesis protein FlhA